MSSYCKGIIKKIADLLRNKIYELRASLQGIHYRILYFFHDNLVAILSHGIIKEDCVPSIEINKAIEKKRILK